MKNKSKKQERSRVSKRKMLLASGATAATLLMAVPALAATSSTTPSGIHSEHGPNSNGHFVNASSTPAFLLSHMRTQNAAFGVIASITGSTITLSHRTKDGMGNVTITTTSSTVYKKNGQADVASDLAVGQRIVAMGAKDSAGNITDATSINIFVPRVRTN